MLNDEGILGVCIVIVEKKVDFVVVIMLCDMIDGVWLVGFFEVVDVIVIG